ncbi:phosphoethanolamine N-methyltransferase-like isoform X1 [Homarus americanus]|uniref:phosphoethanolamine N-methyltransferase-like isoform X1 n=1 Tax=Homarus americanus TaxID=6706 RepID=UPI001C45DC11|nr:phosphoethanolamine N-methyltransferase-like isoform X1 [Homarus americanus]XP_042227673.1 phosphoethanolamine N-methyltransferase-like isoform X1 [Homarus americanus]XP_042227674.1 phosphoethanolamine N-methyltransferase-like isoform X1 [Homarus americanus]XP_042227675.1 phosphoethanolamine N-methyltransferase-like isoform X1 [Homarus americanus]
MSDRVDEVLLQRRKVFWDQQEPSLQAMIQTVSSDGLADDDADEIMAYLPDLTGKRVVDLAAGIGRFTTRMAKVARHVTAVDVAQAFIMENRVANQHLGNISFICDDVVNLDFPAGSLDLVFSNWLLKYLSDAEITHFLTRALKWLSPGGFIFFRESCYGLLGTEELNGNPTMYRSSRYYCDKLTAIPAQDDESAFTLVRVKNILAYINYQNAPNQVCFLAKVCGGDGIPQEPQKQQCRLSPLNAAALQKVFKGPCVTVGGDVSTRDFCARLGLGPGQRVLDVGCGMGGSATFMARHYGVHVHGVDLSSDMIHEAIERQVQVDEEVRKKLHFEMSPDLAVDCDINTYDVIHSRETCHNVSEKQHLFDKLLRCVKPGGTVFITDYCLGSSPPSQPFLAHTHDIAPCYLETVDSYSEKMRMAGFKGVVAKDLSQELIKALQDELSILVTTCGDTDEDKMNHSQVTALWNSKLQWVKDGYLTWSSFMLTK